MPISSARGPSPAPSRSNGGAVDGDSKSWLIIYCAFLIGVFLTGGGSRNDILSLIVLRPLAFVAIAFTLIRFSPQIDAAARPIAWFLSLLAVLMVAQLIPLPPAIWTALPGREVIAETDAILGLEGIWRELSLSPSRTRNALFALAIPVAMLIIIVCKGRRSPQSLVVPLLAAGVASCLFGVMQAFDSAGNPFYLYRITSAEGPVGLFANRNHQAMFLAALLPLLAYLAHRISSHRERKALAVVAGSGLAILFVASAFATGSRAGFILCLLALLLAGTILFFSAHVPSRSSTPTEKQAARRGRITLALIAAGVLAVVGLLAFGSEAAERLFVQNYVAEMRFQLLPHLWAMMWTYFPVGTGFGALEFAYKLIEPDALLSASYLNQAHNEPLQFVIEGGLLAGLLMIAAIALYLRAGLTILREIRQARRTGRAMVWIAPYAWVGLGILLAGSVVDYPLRVPSLMATVVVLAYLTLGPPPQSRSSRGSV